MRRASSAFLKRLIPAGLTAMSLLMLTLTLPPSGFSASEASLRDCVALLSSTTSGKLLMEKAQKLWGVHSPELLLDHLKWGSASKTDAVLIRHYDPKTGTEKRERQVTVYLKSGQSMRELVLDLAHELLHATSRPSWDPYDPTLTAGRYIQAAIEGEGGEVEAVVTECQVASELKARFGIHDDRCQRYLTRSGDVNRDRILKDFYRTGRWIIPLKKYLGSELVRLPLLSEESPKLFSSTGGSPYPVALLEEFQDITHAACENTRKRIMAFSSRKRQPSGETENGSLRFLRTRCHE